MVAERANGPILTAHRVAVGLLVLLAVAGVLVGFERATAAFGNSDEGLNSSVWATCSRSLRQDPIGSALGGRRVDDVVYATHPPLTCGAAAVSEAIFGEHEWASRAPAWLATVALIPLTYILLRRLGSSPLIAASGCLVGVGSPMVVTYGSMLDTPMVAMPVAVAAAIALTGEYGPVRGRLWAPWAVVGVSVLAGLTSWQAGLFVLLAGVATWRWGLRPRRAALYLIGAGVGLALSMVWGWWAYGSLSALRSKLGSRSTGESGLLESLGFQFDWLVILLGLGLLGLVAAVAAVADHRVRPVVLPALVATAAWSIGFHGGAAGHQYWNYFIVLPVALGSAWGLGHLARFIDGHASMTIPGPVVAVTLSVVVVVLSLGVSNQASRAIAHGHPTGQMLQAAELTAIDALPVAGDDQRIWSIVVYYNALDTAPMTRAELEVLARADPAADVLVALPCPEDRATVCDDLSDDRLNEDRLTTAADLVEELVSVPGVPD